MPIDGTIDVEIDPEIEVAFVMNYDDVSPGAYLAAVGGAFEVRASRSGYDSGILTRARLGASTEVVLPEGAVTDWSGLDDFVTLHVEDAGGATVYDGTGSFCPNDFNRLRVSPDGPVDDIHGLGCTGHPLSLGMVWTINEGWAVSLLPQQFPLSLAAGSYQLTLGVAEPYADILGVSGEVTVPMTVSIGSTNRFDGDVDADGDGIEDSVDDFIDADGDGIDDYTDLTLEETESQATEAALDVIGEPAGPEPAHTGRPGAAAHPPRAALPDLASLPALGISVETDPDTGEDLLAFSAVTWNRGPAPMVIDGFGRVGAPGVMDAYQQFIGPGGLPGGSAPIGTLEYHPGGGHDHWHFVDFARYELVAADGGEVVQRSGKESWCLANTDAIDLTVRGAQANGGDLSLDGVCGGERSRWIRETLAVGWGDTYSQNVSGQAFDITGLPNGRYVIRLTANPEGTIYERETTNNVADRPIVLGGVPGARTVEVRPVGLVDTEADFSETGFGADE